MTQCLCDMAFADTNRSKQKDILFVFDVDTVCQLFNLLYRDLRIEGEVKTLKGLFLVKPRLS